MSGYKPRIKSPPLSYTAGLHQVWRHITMSTVLTQEEIPEKGGYKKIKNHNKSFAKNKVFCLQENDRDIFVLHDILWRSFQLF